MGRKRKIANWIVAVLQLLMTEKTAVTLKDLSKKVNKSVSYLRKCIGEKTFSSLNKKRRYIVLRKVVKKCCDRYGFYKDEQTGAIFHREGNIRKTLLFLAKKKDCGISAEEAKKLTGRDCYRAFKQLLENGEVEAATVYGERVYFHPKRHQVQLKNRLTNTKFFPKKTPKNKGERPILVLEEVIKTLTDQPDLSRELKKDLTLIFVQYFKRLTYRGLEALLLFDPRIRDILGFQLHEVPDHTVIWNRGEEITLEDLQTLFTTLVRRLQTNKIVSGKYLVVDATHIFAWASTRKDIQDGDIPGASWGHHEAKFYGYKVHILIDGESELPVAVKLSTGKETDCPFVLPLLEDAEENLDFHEVLAVFADAGYYMEGPFEEVRKQFSVTLNSDINPRRSKALKALKKEIETLFATKGDRIRTVDDALALLPQKRITDFTGEIGTTKDDMICATIRCQLHGYLRTGVERVFSRAKAFFWLERPRTRNLRRVKKHVLYGFCAMFLVALTADRLGFERNRLAYSRVW